MSDVGEVATYPSLKGRTVLVTGGASGIGESIVRHFAAQGSRVGFIDLNGEAGRALTGELGFEPSYTLASALPDMIQVRRQRAEFDL